MRNAVKFWFWTLAGIVLISTQVYKYFINTLTYSWQEAVILFIGIMLMVKPTLIPDYILKFFSKK